jgi:hypothetical protein
MTCHGGTQGINLTTGTDWANDLIGVPSSQGMNIVEPGNANNSYLIRKLENGPGISGSRMPFGANPMSQADINLIRAWINGMPSLGACGSCPGLNCSGPRNYVDGQEAFAFMTAANAVDKAWTETLGYPITIANYYPRNNAQLNAPGTSPSSFIPGAGGDHPRGHELEPVQPQGAALLRPGQRLRPAHALRPLDGGRPPRPAGQRPRVRPRRPPGEPPQRHG